MAIDPRQIDLSPEQKRQLAELAEQTGRPWPQLLDAVLRTYQASKGPHAATNVGKSFYDVMMEDGAIGVVDEGLPSDLATNPKHMDWFGRGAIQQSHAREEAV